MFSRPSSSGRHISPMCRLRNRPPRRGPGRASGQGSRRYLAAQLRDAPRPGRQAPGRPESLDVFRHGRAAPRGETRPRLLARAVRLDPGMARGSARRLRPSQRSAVGRTGSGQDHAAAERQVRSGSLRRLPRRHDPGRQAHVNVGGRFAINRKEPPVLGSAIPLSRASSGHPYPGDAEPSITWRSFQPRVSATYALSEGRTLRGLLLRFTDQLDSRTMFAINAFPRITGLFYNWGDANGDGRVQSTEVDTSEAATCFPTASTGEIGSVVPLDQIAKDLKPPSTDEFIVGVEVDRVPSLGLPRLHHRSRRSLGFASLIGTTR